MQVNEASERWIREGKAYKNKLNDWLDLIIMDGKRSTEPVPEETRQLVVYDGSDRYVNNRLFRLRGLNERRRDELAITNTVFKDVKRYLFLKGHEPMIW